MGNALDETEGSEKPVVITFIRSKSTNNTTFLTEVFDWNRK